MTDADRSAKRREILDSYSRDLRSYRNVRNRAVWRAGQEFDEQRARLRRRRDAALEALGREAKLP